MPILVELSTTKILIGKLVGTSKVDELIQELVDNCKNVMLYNSYIAGLSHVNPEVYEALIDGLEYLEKYDKVFSINEILEQPISIKALTVISKVM